MTTLEATQPRLEPHVRSEAAAELRAYVDRAQQGDGSAFEELVKRTRGLARKTALPLLRADQVEDAMQEAYLVVYQKLHHLKNPEAFQAWLVRIVLHVCYALRKKTPLVAEPDPNATGGGGDESGAVVRRLDLKAALDKLKEDDRNILILREFLNLSYEEVAYALRLPIGTVRSRLHNGRKKLAELLGS